MAMFMLWFPPTIIKIVSSIIKFLFEHALFISNTYASVKLTKEPHDVLYSYVKCQRTALLNLQSKL